MTISEAKKEYNKLLKRHYKAVEYFDSGNVSQDEKERFLPNYQEILKGLNYYLDKIHAYTPEEMLEGFM